MTDCMNPEQFPSACTSCLRRKNNLLQKVMLLSLLLITSARTRR